MTTHQTSIDEDEFQAFVDGQLTPERRRAVMAYLAANTDEAARMGEYRALGEELHLLYDEVLYEPLPKRLRVEQYRGRRSWVERLGRWVGLGVAGWMPRCAAIATLALVSATGGWTLHTRYSPAPVIETPAMSFARQAANAHIVYAPDLRHPVEFGPEQQDSFLLWLTERLGQTVHVPTLEDLGFALIGGRLLPASGQAAAQLMYENPDSQRITLYIRERWTPQMTGAQEGTFFATESGIHMVYWTEGPLAYALIGALDREQLFATAKIIQQQRSVPTLPTTTPDQTATTEKNAT